MNLFTSFENKNDKPPKKGILYSDGGSRGNPGPAAGGCVVYDENKKELDRVGNHYGIQTNNFAEYQGLIDGLTLALKHDITELDVYLDSNLIVEQMNGNWKVKHVNIKPLFEKAKSLEEKFQKVQFRHVLRHKNKVADAIVNETLDKNI
jgi:ribonuclease HI